MLFKNDCYYLLLKAQNHHVLTRPDYGVENIRIVLVRPAQLMLQIYKTDVSAAFLNGIFSDEAFPGFWFLVDLKVKIKLF